MYIQCKRSLWLPTVFYQYVTVIAFLQQKSTPTSIILFSAQFKTGKSILISSFFCLLVQLSALMIEILSMLTKSIGHSFNRTIAQRQGHSLTMYYKLPQINIVSAFAMLTSCILVSLLFTSHLLPTVVYVNFLLSLFYKMKVKDSR